MSAHRAGRRPLARVIIGAVASLVTVAVALALAAAGFVTHIANTYQGRTTTIAQAFPSGSRPSQNAHGALNVLLLGSDSRAQLDPDGDHAAGGRSDTMMVLHIAADRRSVSVMSILRDSWVDVPGHGMAKINAAYSWGGVPLTVQTVEGLLGLHIDHVAEIDFAGFAGMTDALGGVDVRSDQAFTARGHRFTAGVNHLDGDAALAFVRERYAFTDADRQRVRNQQAFLRGIADTVTDRGTLTSPSRISGFVGAMSEHLSVDSGLTARRLATLGWELRGLRTSEIGFFTLPAPGGGTSADGQSYVVVDQEALGSIRQALAADTLPQYLAATAGGL